MIDGLPARTRGRWPDGKEHDARNQKIVLTLIKKDVWTSKILFLLTGDDLCAGDRGKSEMQL